MKLNRYNAIHSVRVHFNHVAYRKQIMSVGCSGLRVWTAAHFPENGKTSNILSVPPEKSGNSIVIFGI